MTQKILVVFGVTGNQGSSVVNHVLKDTTLSKEFKIRGITRDPSKPDAQALQKQGVELVKADVKDANSLRQALAGANTVFAMTTGDYSNTTKEGEYIDGKAIVDAALDSGVKWFIWSSLPHVDKLSGGKYTHVIGFDAKAEVQEYLETLQDRMGSIYFQPASFMQNIHSNTKPRPAGDGTYMMAAPISGSSLLPLIDTAGDTGKWVNAMLKSPDKYKGTTFCCATRLYTQDEQAEIISKATGKTVKYMALPPDTYRGFLPPQMADMLTEMRLYQGEFGYYGADTKEKVEWAAAQCEEPLTTLEEYLAKNPLTLD